MRYAIIVIGFVSLLCWLACQESRNPSVNTAKYNAQAPKNDICDLYPSNGQAILSKLGCINCHIHGDGHSIDSTYLSDYGKKQTVNFNELTRLDSIRIHNYLFPSAHRGLLKENPNFNKLTACEIRQMIFYLRHANDQQY